MQRRAHISFIIPAYNEEKYIGATLQSIHRALNPDDEYEIIVVDNGSLDNTPAIARQMGASVLSVQSGTIGSLRNAGARHSRGDILVFIDADVTLTTLWRGSFERAEAEIRADPLTASGSMCAVPSNASWIERTWFAPHNDGSLTHLGSAHFIINRETFLDVGGFDESLATGEDYELCHRLRDHGGRLYRLPRGSVEHHGYPKTIRDFVRREMWHGSSDAASLRSVLRSKVALAALVFVVLHATIAAAFITRIELAAGFALAGIVGICVASSVRTYRSAGLSIIMINSAVYYLYYCGRAASFLGIARRARRNRNAGAEAIATANCGA